jgi:hypothetical protein
MEIVVFKHPQTKKIVEATIVVPWFFNNIYM